MEHELIQFVGVNKLPVELQEEVHKLSSEYYPKIKRQIKNLTSLVIHIKQYSKEGTRHKFSLRVRVEAPTRVFESTKAADWELNRGLHKAFDDVQRQIQHALHTDDQRPRFRG